MGLPSKQEKVPRQGSFQCIFQKQDKKKRKETLHDDYGTVYLPYVWHSIIYHLNYMMHFQPTKLCSVNLPPYYDTCTTTFLGPIYHII